MSELLADGITLFIAVLFIKSFLDSFFDESKHIDIKKYVMLESNYHKDKPTPVPKKNSAKPKKQVVTNKPDVKTSDTLCQQLRNDCDLAMKSLGTDSKQRQYLLKAVFDVRNPKSIQEFLQLAYANIK